MTYKLTPALFNGVNINDGTNYTSRFLRESDPLALVTEEPIETVVQGSFPTSSRSQPQSIIMPLTVTLLSTTQAALNAFKALFDPQVGDVILTVTDGSVAPVTYRLTVRVVSTPILQGSTDTFTVRLYVARPIFLNDTATSDAQTANSSPKTWTETNAGTVRTYPTLMLQPTVAKSHTADYLHRSQVVFCWESEFAGTDSNGYGYPVQVNVGGSALDLSAEHTAGRLLANGDDLRVLVDGVEVDRWIDATLAADYVWINCAFKPRVYVTNAVAMGNGTTPAAGEWMELSNPLGTLGLPPSGVIVFEDEAVQYDAITATAIRVYARGACNTTVAAHAITTTGKWMEHEIEILTDYTGAGAAPASTALKPVIDLANSTNLYHARPGPQIYPSTPLRTGQMAIDSRDINLLSPSMRINDTGSVLEFIDSPAVAGQPQGNGVALYCPCGVKTGGAYLAQDVTVPANMLARAYGTDAEGYEALLAEWNPDTDGAGVTITPSAALQRIRYEAMVRTVTAAEPTIDTNGALGDSNNARGQLITFDGNTKMTAISLGLKRTAGADGNIYVGFHADSSGLPGTAIMSPVVLCAAAAIGTTYGEHLLTLASPYILPAGTYHITCYITGDTTGDVYWGYGRTSTAKANRETQTATVWAANVGTDHWFRILGDGSVVQPEVPAASAAEVDLDNINITFDNTTPRTPYCAVQAQESIYMLRGALKNDTTGQTLTALGIPVALNTIITIDTLAHTVIRSDTGANVPGLISPTDISDWLYLVAAANSLRYTEAGIGTVVVTTGFRDAFA